ncbi:hypothetical protein ACIQTT_12495 [Microbacterium sp. NPDC090225]|uniref:hypothetical protein n=1 Tax=Microbacterium sp. NPDC090225 TaxID=3364207 RepID=UPI0037F46003
MSSQTTVSLDGTSGSFDGSRIEIDLITDVGDHLPLTRSIDRIRPVDRPGRAGIRLLAQKSTRPVIRLERAILEKRQFERTVYLPTLPVADNILVRQI